MTDLEMIKLCAEAMGIRLEWDGDPREWQPMFYEGKTYHLYDPLHDDAQAMALVKKFGLFLSGPCPESPEWDVSHGINDGMGKFSAASNGNLNRAIVECVAKMQAARTTI